MPQKSGKKSKASLPFFNNHQETTTLKSKAAKAYHSTFLSLFHSIRLSIDLSINQELKNFPVTRLWLAGG